MKHFTATRDQSNELEALRYWIAEKAYTQEREPADAVELHRIGETIRGIFDKLDRLGVPFWVQNSVLCWAEDWRDTLRRSTRDAMRPKGIDIFAI